MPIGHQSFVYPVLRGVSLCLLLACLLPAFGSMTGPAVAAPARPPASEICSPKAAARVEIVDVGEHDELTLADGRILRLAGLEAPTATPTDPDLGQRAHDWLSDQVLNQPLSADLLDARPDRWGRIAAAVYLASQAGEAAGVPRSEGPRSLAKDLVAQGYARVVPDQEKTPCMTQLLQEERQAREAKRGLWADPYYAVVAATDTEAFAERAGSLILAEGKVTNVKVQTARTTLFFGPRRRSHLAVTVLQRNVKIFEAAGLHFRDLIGQTLRVRGLLETRFGPEIEVTGPNDLERLPDPDGAASPPREATAAQP